MNVKRFDAMAVDGKNVVFFARNRIERDTALRIRKRRWVGLSRWCVSVLVETRLADMPCVCCE